MPLLMYSPPLPPPPGAPSGDCCIVTEVVLFLKFCMVPLLYGTAEFMQQLGLLIGVAALAGGKSGDRSGGSSRWQVF